MLYFRHGEDAMRLSVWMCLGSLSLVGLAGCASRPVNPDGAPYHVFRIDSLLTVDIIAHRAAVSAEFAMAKAQAICGTGSTRLIGQWRGRRGWVWRFAC